MSDRSISFKYFYGKESDMLTFYRIPKLLVVDEYFKTLSSDAKILYGLMLDRISLSQKNGWIDEENRVYIYFSIEDVMEYLNIGKNKAIGLFAALDSEKGIGLIERIKQGQGKPSKIYVKSFMRDEDLKFENQTSEEKEDTSEVLFSNFKKFNNETFKGTKFKPLEVLKPNTNKNIDIYIDSSNNKNDLIKSDQKEDIKKCEIFIKQNIEYPFLIKNNPYDKEMIDGIVDLMLEVLISENEYILIASNKYPKDLVKEKFLQLGYSHIEYIMKCINENTTKVRNVKKYLLAALFNAPTTIDGYYKLAVSYDNNN